MIQLSAFSSLPITQFLASPFAPEVACFAQSEIQSELSIRYRPLHKEINDFKTFSKLEMESCIMLPSLELSSKSRKYVSSSAMDLSMSEFDHSIPSLSMIEIG